MRTQLVEIDAKAINGPSESPTTLGVWDWDIGGNLIYADDAVAKAFGLSAALTKKGLPPEIYFANIHHEDRQMVIDHSLRSIATIGYCSDNFRIVTPAGAKWVASQGRCFADRDNNPKCFVGLISEIAPQYDFEHQDPFVFPGGTSDDDILYLCLHAKRIASHGDKRFLTYLLEMVIAEVTDSKSIRKC